jgi:hypothetical protein
MTLHKDNIQVFEYGTSGAASREVESFLRSYGKQSVQMPWIPMVHAYVEGPLVVLYTGNREEVISTLNQVLGNPLASRVSSAG